MTNNMIYASPFVTGGTACYNSAMSMVVTVLARLECADVWIHRFTRWNTKSRV